MVVVVVEAVVAVASKLVGFEEVEEVGDEEMKSSTGRTPRHPSAENLGEGLPF